MPECKPDITKLEKLKSCEVAVTNTLNFVDILLPPTMCKFVVNASFSKQYFVDLHNTVKSFGVQNYKGARIP